MPASAITLSFMSANYVARELGYGAADEWGPFDDCDRTRPSSRSSTFEARFDAMLEPIGAAGFDAIDLWFGHLELALGDTRPCRDRP